MKSSALLRSGLFMLALGSAKAKAKDKVAPLGLYSWEHLCGSQSGDWGLYFACFESSDGPLHSIAKRLRTAGANVYHKFKDPSSTFFTVTTKAAS